MHALQEYIKSGNANAGLPVMNAPVVTSFDAAALKNILPKYGPIDTTEGQRAQAELCLEMARQMSDPTTSDNLLSESARYQAEADEIETGVKSAAAKDAPEQS